MRKILLLSLVISTTVHSACAGGGRRPQPEPYTVCISYPENGGVVCNKTGDPKDNFWVLYPASRLFRCMPKDDWIALEEELEILRHGRKGDLRGQPEETLSQVVP